MPPGVQIPMKKRYPLAGLLLAACTSAAATDYMVDFSRMTDLNLMRPLVTGCKDFDAMEIYRDKLEKTADLETLRALLAPMGLGQFNACPDGIAGIGIAAAKQDVTAAPPAYSVDFSRVTDFETLRPLFEGCKDFEGLEWLKDALQSSKNLNALGARLKQVGFANFNQCPAGITGVGIAPIK